MFQRLSSYWNRESELNRKLYHSAFQGIVEGVMFIANSRDVIEVNSIACSILGVPYPSLVGSSLDDPLWGDMIDEKGRQIPVGQCPVSITLDTGRVFQDTLISVRSCEKPGERKWLSVTTYPIDIRNGNVHVAVSAFMDVTQARERRIELETENSQLRRQVDYLKSRQQKAAFLGEVTDFLQSCRSVEEASEVLPLLMGQHFHGVSGTIGLLSASRDLIETIASWGDACTQDHYVPDQCWGLRRGKPHVSGNGESPTCGHLVKSNLTTICTPLQAHGETIGSINVQGDEESINLLSGILARTAEQLALAIANLQLRQRLRNQGIRDPLTGLFNRHYMEESLDRELRQGTRHNRPVCVIMFDIDHFKSFNDNFGHIVGDYVLKELASYLHKSIRGGDIICRYGGEEFVVILPGCSLSDAIIRADNIRSDLMHLKLQSDGVMLPTLTASFGVAGFPDHGMNSIVLIKLADEALYQAKQNGRNQVITAQQIPLLDVSIPIEKSAPGFQNLEHTV